MTAPGLDNLFEAPFSAPLERRSALDRAHRGDLVGALGRVASYDLAPRRTWSARLVTLLAVAGPGLLVMVAGNDAGGISVYAQAGQDYGLGMLWLLVPLAPVLYVVQEMAARLGAVTGAGHARLIFERFGKRWGRFALADLLLLNLLTIVTEFIGVSLALGYFGVSRYVAVPIAAVALIALVALGSFRRWERVMLILVGCSLAVIPLALLGAAHAAHTRPAAAIGADVVHGAGRGLFFAVAIAGATVAPWQIFFQQSTVVDKRITPRWLGFERAELAAGAFLFLLGAVGVFLATALTLETTARGFVDAGRAAHGLAAAAGPWAGALFALVLLDGSILGAAAVTLATAYALGDVLGTRHSLHRRWSDAPHFHGSFALSLVIAAAVVLAPGAPLGLVTLGVQALAGVLVPSATVLLLLLANDRDVLGPHVNPRWLNLLAGLVVALLLGVSALLTLTLLVPHVRVAAAAPVVGAIIAGGIAVLAWQQLRAGTVREEGLLNALRGTGAGASDRQTWTMPPLESLPPPARSATRSAGLVLLRAYLLFAAGLLGLRIVEALWSR